VPREIRTLWLASVCVLAVAACKQKSKEESEPTAAPSAAAAPAETAPPTPPPAETIPPPMQPPAAPAAAAGPKSHESLTGCCTALHKQSDTATGSDKSLYTQAASNCDAISKLVAAGTTKKAAAVTALRASIKGGKLPPGCD
jgi:hypothetical protein